MRFKNIETCFCRWKSTNNNDMNIFPLLENPCIFLFEKEKIWKRIFKTNSELSQSRTEKQIMLFKATVNCLFNNIWCYLVIACFDCKIGVFQQTVVKGLLYPWRVIMIIQIFLYRDKTKEVAPEICAIAPLFQ